MHDIFRVLRRASRALRRAPGFTIAAVLTLALGIGGSTVVFSVVHALLLRPLPYANPERLVVARSGPLWPIYEQWREATAIFEGLAAYNRRAANLSGDGESERITLARATGNFLTVVGVRPALGREFAGEELRAGQDNVVLLTDALWRRRFGASRDVLDRTLVLDDRPYTIVGVTADLRRPGSLEAPLPLIYFAYPQLSFASSQMTLLLKGRGEAAASRVATWAAMTSIDRVSRTAPTARQRTWARRSMGQGGTEAMAQLHRKFEITTPPIVSAY